jgi:hypothetical protein
MRRLFPEPWLNPRHGLPPDETPVLVIVRGERRIGELRWERPSHEETFEAFRYWDDPTNDGQDWEWNDILCWTLLPEIPNEEANTATQS